MKYKRIQGLAYNLHMINTDKFKTVTIRMDFRKEVSKEDVTYRNLLSKILLESSKKYPTKRLLSLATGDLYGAYLSMENSLSGKAIVTSIKLTVLNDSYTEDGLLKQAINFLMDVILNPNVDDGTFDEKSFNLVKNTMIDELKSIKDNTSSYSKMRALEIVGDDSLSYRTCGYMEDLETITSSSLYEYYMEMIKNNVLDIFVVGDIKFDEISAEIKKNLTINTVKRSKIDHIYRHKKFRKRAKKVIEDVNNSQSKLVMIYKVDKLNHVDVNYTMPIYSYILGGGPDSRLFKNVREKHSLCYSVYATYFSVSNYFMISAGINAKDFEKTVNLIKKEMKKLNKGHFDETDLDKAKNTYLSSYKEVLDTPDGIINSYVVHEYLDADLISMRSSEIVKVTKSMVEKITDSFHLELVYLLKGDEENE